MKYALLNGLLGVSLIAYGVLLSGSAWLLVWFGLCFIAVGMAYAKNLPLIYGKRPDGTLPLWSWILFLPLHLYAGLIWHVLRLFSREPVFAMVTDGVLVGRRVLSHELPDTVRTVIDLTAEFREPSGIVSGREYRSFPILDASTPDEGALRAFIGSLPTTPVFIHCAQGHGRTGLFTLAYLVSRGICSSLNEAKALLATARPRLQLNDEQERFLRRLFPS